MRGANCAAGAAAVLLCLLRQSAGVDIASCTTRGDGTSDRKAPWLIFDSQQGGFVKRDLDLTQCNAAAGA